MVIVFATFDRLTTKLTKQCSREDFKNVRLHRFDVSREDLIWPITRSLRNQSPNGWCWWKDPPESQEDERFRELFGSARRRLPW